LKNIVSNNRVFFANKPKKFVFNKIMYYLKLYCFYEINVTIRNTEYKEMFLSVYCFDLF